MQEFKLQILSAEGTFYEGACEALVVPTLDGKRGILANHSNYIEAVAPGELKFTVPGEKPRYAFVSEGMVKTEENEVLVLVDTAERPEDIDANKAKREEALAKEALLQKASYREYRETQANLKRSMIRLKIKNDHDLGL